MSERDPRTYAIIGAAMAVHQELGRGFLEAVYQEALMRELCTAKIPFLREVDLPIVYKGSPLSVHYRADFVCYSSIIVELKALSCLGGLERSQIINYLKATNYEVGLLLNFGADSLEFERFSLSFIRATEAARKSRRTLSPTNN